jgi:hypothetical protein
LTSIFKGQDAVLSLAGATQIGDQKSYVDAALKAGVKRFIPSEFGGDTRNDEFNKALPLFAGKKSVIEYLKTKESEGLSWTGIFSGPFYDWGLHVGFLGFDFKTKTANIVDNGKTYVTTSNLSTIGKAIASILSKPDVAAATANKYIAIETATVTQSDILAAAEEASGSKWIVKNVDSLVERKSSLEAVANGHHEAFYGVLQSYIFGGQEENHSDNRNLDVGIWNDKLGLPKEDYKDAIKQLVEANP